MSKTRSLNDQPVSRALFRVSTLMSIGIFSVLLASQALGRGKDEGKQHTTMHAMTLRLALSSAAALLFCRAAPWLFGLMGAQGKVLSCRSACHRRPRPGIGGPAQAARPTSTD